METIVVSAVSIRKGGTLTILRECLRYLSSLAAKGKYRVVAIVHDRSLADFSGIEYIERKEIVGNWFKRLWFEYVSSNSLSKNIGDVYLWLSLHDTTPNVKAKKRAVYCQTSFPFMKWKFNDLFFDYKIVLFSLFTKYVYKINSHKNDYMVVQAEWLRNCFSELLNIDRDKFIVSVPQITKPKFGNIVKTEKPYTFIYAATPDCHKNFEQICKAASLLEKEIGRGKFQVIFTINGNENKYSRWLFKNWGNIDSLHFCGFMSKEMLFEKYNEVDSLIFSSRVETWGLPISEFSSSGKPMLLVDLPYSHETSEGAEKVSFFGLGDALDLKDKMKSLIFGDYGILNTNSVTCKEEPCASSWKDMFDILLNK